MSDRDPIVCPSVDDWLEVLADGRGRPEALEERPDLLAHLDDCAACRATVDEARRYETMLLRAKVPGLSAEQRQSLDERVRMMAAQWSPPPRVSPRLAWGLALAAAAVLVLVVARPFLARRIERHQDFSERLSTATLPAHEAGLTGLRTGAVDGDVQVADRDGRWRPMVTGEALQGGMRLRGPSAPGHLAGRVVVPGRFELVLAPATEIDVLASHGLEAVFRLRQGEVDCQVEKLRPGQRFAVMFAGYRAMVVGTRFTVRHTSASSGVAVQVSEGAVRVDAADEAHAPLAETTTTVRAGQRWSYAAGRMALEPIPLPAEPPVVEVPPAAATSPQADPGAAPGTGPAAAAPAPPEAGPQAAPQPEPAEAAAAIPTKAASRREPAVKSKPAARSFLIEVPPQAMSPEEVRKLQQQERERAPK